LSSSISATQKVSDKSLKIIGQFTNLQELKLYGAGVTDAGLRELVTLRKLKRLYLPGTAVTEKGITEFKKTLPGIFILPPPPDYTTGGSRMGPAETQVPLSNSLESQGKGEGGS